MKKYPTTSFFCMPYWKIDENFDLELHVHRHRSPMNDTQLREFIGKSLSQGHPANRPPWSITVFDHYIHPDGSVGSALMTKVHHAYGDGFNMLRLLNQCFDPKYPPAVISSSNNSAVGPVSAEAKAEVAQSRSNKTPKASRPGALTAIGLGIGSLLKLCVGGKDPPSVFKAASPLDEAQPMSVSWRTPAFSIEGLKVLGRRTGTTVNEIMLAALSASLAKHASNRVRFSGTEPADIRTAVWVSLRPLSDVYKTPEQLPLMWGNGNLGSVVIQLPVGPYESASDGKAALSRLQEISRRTRPLVHSPEPLVAAAILRFFGSVPGPMLRLLWPHVGYNMSMSMSNLIGPHYPVQFGSLSTVARMLFVVPPHRTLGIFVCIVSYNDRFTVMMAVDPALMSVEEVDAVSILSEI